MRNRLGIRGFKAMITGSNSHSRRYGNRGRDWKEIAGVIRFDFMGPHAIDSPVSRGDAGRYVMLACGPSLPIQDDIGEVTAGSDDANIEKCLCSEIGSREVDRIRSPRNSIRPAARQTATVKAAPKRM